MSHMKLVRLRQRVREKRKQKASEMSVSFDVAMHLSCLAQELVTLERQVATIRVRCDLLVKAIAEDAATSREKKGGKT